MDINQDVTLKIKRSVLEQAVAYAHEKGTNLSALVENLLRLTTQNRRLERVQPIEQLDPRVQQLVGVVHLKDSETGLDGELCKAEYMGKE